MQNPAYIRHKLFTLWMTRLLAMGVGGGAKAVPSMVVRRFCSQQVGSRNQVNVLKKEGGEKMLKMLQCSCWFTATVSSQSQIQNCHFFSAKEQTRSKMASTRRYFWRYSASFIAMATSNMLFWLSSTLFTIIHDVDECGNITGRSKRSSRLVAQVAAGASDSHTSPVDKGQVGSRMSLNATACSCSETSDSPLTPPRPWGGGDISRFPAVLCCCSRDATVARQPCLPPR